MGGDRSWKFHCIILNRPDEYDACGKILWSKTVENQDPVVQSIVSLTS